MDKFTSFVYTILVSIAVLLFVALGAYAFYPEPEYNTSCYELGGRSTYTSEYDRCQTSRSKDKQEHAKIKSGIILGVSAVISMGSHRFLLAVKEVRDGVLLGAVFTAIYGAMWALIGGHRILVFISGALVLDVVIDAAYNKFRTDN